MVDHRNRVHSAPATYGQRYVVVPDCIVIDEYKRRSNRDHADVSAERERYLMAENIGDISSKQILEVYQTYKGELRHKSSNLSFAEATALRAAAKQLAEARRRLYG